jgi:hypothetical protein
MSDQKDKDFISMLTDETFKEAENVSDKGLSNEEYFNLRNSNETNETNNILEFKPKEAFHSHRELNSLDMMIRMGFKNIAGDLSQDKLFKININDFEVDIPSNWSVFEELCLEDISSVQIHKNDQTHKELFDILSLMLGEESERIFLVKNFEKLSLLNFNSSNSNIADNFESLLLMEITAEPESVQKIA